MIKFQGEISQECKTWFLKREYKDSFKANLFFALLSSILILIVGLLWDLIFLAFLALPITIIILSFFQGFYKNLAKKIPETIEIDNIAITGNISRSIETVKSVIDVGDWYVFNFYFPYKNRYFVCQKDLLVEGTIEEFEQLFEGKIERKLK